MGTNGIVDHSSSYMGKFSAELGENGSLAFYGSGPFSPGKLL